MADGPELSIVGERAFLFCNPSQFAVCLWFFAGNATVWRDVLLVLFLLFEPPVGDVLGGCLGDTGSDCSVDSVASPCNGSYG